MRAFLSLLDYVVLRHELDGFDVFCEEIDNFMRILEYGYLAQRALEDMLGHQEPETWREELQ